ncbi:MAG: ABC transporter permease [Bacteroidales bacterium]|nr:ABC transporter permease [Bacteroidales bacterium]
MNKIKNHQLYRLTAAHIKEIVREPVVLFWGIVFPILMAWGLGIAFSSKQDLNREIAVIKHSNTSTIQKSALQNIIEHYPDKEKGDYALSLKNEKLGNVKLSFHECTEAEAHVMLKKGTISLIIDVVDDKLVYYFDPVNAEAQLIYQLVKGVVYNGPQYYASHQEEIKPLTVTGTRYIDFLIPGLIAMGIMMSSSWGISYTLIERRSKKLLRRMVATPMRKSNLLIALIFARFIMNIIEAVLLYAFAYWYFDLQIQGNLIALALLFIAGNIAFAGISVLISSHTANSEVGNGLINAVVTPMMVLSGVFFSYHHFPAWAITFIENLPLTMLADGMRSIFNEGAGLLEIWKSLLVLSATGIITFVVGLKIFKWY